MSDTTELKIDPAPVDNSPPPEVDPQGEVRLAIAEKYEARRLAEVEAQREQMGLLPTSLEAEPAESGVETEAAITPGPEQVEPSTISPAPAPAPVTPQQPQLHPVQAPDGQVYYCTIEQIAQLAGLGAGVMATPQQPQPVPQPVPTHQPSFDTERARAIANKLSFGDPEEQARALIEYAQEVRGPVIDQNGIRQQIKQELTAEMQVERDLQQIGAEHPQVFGNRYATVAAAAAVNDLRANPYWASRPPLEVYREACRTVARDFNLVSPQPQPGSQNSAAPQAAPASAPARLERKRAAPSIPVATDRRVAMADDTPRAPTAAEVVDQIRKARGQPSLR